MSTSSSRVERCRACGGRILIGQWPPNWVALMGGVLVHYGAEWSCMADYGRGVRAPQAGDVF